VGNMETMSRVAMVAVFVLYSLLSLLQKSHVLSEAMWLDLISLAVLEMAGNVFLDEYSQSP